jgi:hypothetical protein
LASDTSAVGWIEHTGQHLSAITHRPAVLSGASPPSSVGSAAQLVCRLACSAAFPSRFSTLDLSFIPSPIKIQSIRSGTNLASGSWSDHVTSETQPANLPPTKGLGNLSTSKHHCHSILFCPLQSEGTQPLQMAGSSKKASPKSPRRARQGKAAASGTESASRRPKRKRQGKAAASETESASKSPKTTRQGKTAASETDSASKSPKITRQGKSTMSETGSSNFNNEDYNIRSLERTTLLTKIKGVIENAPISPIFWACCQLADINSLQDIARTPRWMLLSHQDSLAFIALQYELLGF